jgi:hypothetical protein
VGCRHCAADISVRFPCEFRGIERLLRGTRQQVTDAYGFVQKTSVVLSHDRAAAAAEALLSASVGASLGFTRCWWTALPGEARGNSGKLDA